MNVNRWLHIDRRRRRLGVAHHEPARPPTVKVRTVHSMNVGRLDMHVNKKVASAVSREEDAPFEIFHLGLEMNPTP